MPIQPVQSPRTKQTSIPAPLGGWNARDGVPDMDPQDAVIMENFFPTTSRVELRRGYEVHASGMSGAVETLFTWAKGTSAKMFAANQNNIYDVTANASASAVLSGMSNNRWQYVNFGTAGGQFIVAVNGEDDPKKYDGSTWATTTITGSGLTASTLIHVTSHKERIFLVEDGTLNFWYLGVNAIAGGATKFPLHSYAQKGGELTAIGTWTIDGGAGVDDLAVFITSKGEVFVFQGTDPSNASNWSLIGRFVVGAPVGRRCFVNIAGDLVIITEDGFVPLSRALLSSRADPNIAISDKIRGAVNTAVRDNGSKYGWEGTLYPKGNMVLFNIPTVENSLAEQYVANLTTTSWCKFTGWNANTFAVFNDELYFGGSDGIVYKADTGRADNGTDITGQVQPAFSYFGQPGQLKRFNMIRPTISSDGTVTPAIEVNVDFENVAPTSEAEYTGSNTAVWDESAWDVTPWAGSENIQRDWFVANGIGYSGTINMKVAAQGMTFNFYSVDYIMEGGGFL